MGVTATTKAYVRPAAGGFEARMGVAVLGQANMKREQLERLTPFDAGFKDNYIEGSGPTEAEALEKMKEDMEALSKTLFI